MVHCVQTTKNWVHDKKRYSEGKKDKCLLALALHIVGNPI